VLKIAIEHAVPATTRNHGFWTRLSFFSVDVDCFFFFLSASSRAAVDPVVVDSPEMFAASVLCISEESSALPTGETIIIPVVCAESCVPSEETTEDPVASDAPSKTSFFSRFFRSFRSFRSLRLLELNMFVVVFDETPTLVLFLLAAWICSCTSSRATSSSSSKCKRPPKRVVPGIFFLSLSLSLSFAQSFSFARALKVLLRKHRCSEYFRKVQKIHETKLDLLAY
jgi:hypothetical protein